MKCKKTVAGMKLSGGCTVAMKKTVAASTPIHRDDQLRTALVSELAGLPPYNFERLNPFSGGWFAGSKTLMIVLVKIQGLLKQSDDKIEEIRLLSCVLAI